MMDLMMKAEAPSGGVEDHWIPDSGSEWGQQEQENRHAVGLMEREH